MKTMTLLVAGLAILFSGTLCHGNVYSFQDESGVLHFTNITPVNKKYRTVIYAARPQRSFSDGQQRRSLLAADRKELVFVARTYLGSPYKLGGNTTTGIDCSGFVKQVFSAFDVKLPRTAREQFHAGTPIEKKDLVAGDLVFFRSPKSKEASHVGIFLDDDRFIHATTRNGGGVRIDSVSDEYYSRTFLGASRLVP